MAVKNLVYDTKKLTMAELKKALAANFEGEYEKVGKMCYEAPKHGNDIPEVNKLLRRVYDSILPAFQNVDGGGNYISQDIKSAPDPYTKSIHNLMGLVTGRAAERQEGRRRAHRRQPLGHAGDRCQRSHRAGHVGGQGHGRGQVQRHAHEHEAPARPAQDPQGPGERAAA